LPDLPAVATDADAADEAAAVERFLRCNPGFLAARPELYRRLDPPRRVHGEAVADHMAAMLAAARREAEAMTARADSVLAAGRAAAGLAARVQEAVLALIACTDPADCVAAEFPALLAVDAASLCIEAARPTTRRLPAGTVAALLGGRAVLFRPNLAEPGDGDAVLLHGEAARLAHHEALVRIPGEGPPALLALVSRDAAVLDPVQGAGALAFLGRALAAALGR
jgi:uncharacterized protein YigA (DUF484 family)